MPRLTRVWVWPDRGAPHKRWDDAPENDAFLRTSRRVSEAFRVALEREGVRAEGRDIELDLDPEPAGDEIVVHPDVRPSNRGAETASVLLPRGFHLLEEPLRAFYVADVLELAARAIGEHRGWDTAGLGRAMDVVRAADYAYTWVGEWHDGLGGLRTRLEVDLPDDGLGRARLTVASVAGEVLARSEPFVVGSSRSAFRTLDRSVRWTDEGTIALRAKRVRVEVEVATGRVRDLRGARAPLAPATPVPDGALPRIRVEDVDAITFTIGGGPLERVPKRYLRALEELVGHLVTDPDWVAWWRATGAAEVHLTYDFDTRQTRPDLEIGDGLLSATVLRERSEIARGEDGERMALDDVSAVLALVRLTTGVGEHPPLRHPAR
ncbi:hypothetical protein QT381_02815 [Galbitalea sp. SE-J8]|uniref:hypothetical protein n=1 Tax=Galbitalea sp. SE-J8 TaxID=3054952 RepID=UPI00259D17D7|nr:hypothetical protein [Galbitalea sp. SE-J8]MDM4761936.1 hypothetical protein [Galbitalea sp. SE-J8]